MSLTALNTITLPQNATFPLTEDLIGMDLANQFGNFLGVPNPVLDGATGTLSNDILRLTGTMETLINLAGVLEVKTVKVTLFLFDVVANGWPERHCLFLTEKITDTNFSLGSLLSGYTPNGQLPAFLDGAADAFLSQIDFAKGAANRQLLFSTIDYSNDDYATAPCPILTDAATKDFCTAANIIKETCNKGFTFQMTPAVQATELLGRLSIPSIGEKKLTTTIRPTFSSFELVTTYYPTNKPSIGVGKFKFICESLRFVFDCQFATAVNPAIGITGQVKIGSEAVNYEMGLSLGSKTISVQFIDFPTFMDLSDAIKKDWLKEQLKNGIPNGDKVIGGVLKKAKITNLSWEVSFGNSWGVTQLALGLGSATPIEFIPNIINVDPHFGIQLQDPFTANRQYSMQLEGLWVLGSGANATQLATSVVKSNTDFTLYAGLANGSSINLKNLVTYAISDETLKKQIPNVTVLDLEATADFANKSYELEVDIISDWVLTVPYTSIDIGLKELEFYINFSQDESTKKTALTEFDLKGWLSFASVNLQMQGTYTNTDGWFFRAHANPGPITVDQLFGNIAPTPGGMKVPSNQEALGSFPTLGKGTSPDNIKLNGLYVEYQKGIKPTATAPTNPPTKNGNGQSQPSANSKFSFFASLDTNIELLDGKIILDKILARFEYVKNDGKSVLTGTIHGDFEIKDGDKHLTGIMLEAQKLASTPTDRANAALAGGKKAKEKGDYVFSGGNQPNEKIPIGKLLDGIANKLGIPTEAIPDVINHFEVDYLHLEYHSKTKDFIFNCHCQVSLDENDPTNVADASLKVQYLHGPNKGDFRRIISGVLLIGDKEFDLELEKKKTTGFGSEKDFQESIMLGAFKNKDQEGINIHHLVESFSSDLATMIPKGLTLSMKDIFFSRYNKKAIVPKNGGKTFGNQGANTTTTTNSINNQNFSGFLLGADLDFTLSLNDLPIVGKKLPEGTNMGIRNLKLVISSKAFKHPNLVGINELLGKNGITPLPEKPVAPHDSTTNNPNNGFLPKGLSIAAELVIGDLVKPILLSTGGSRPTMPGMRRPGGLGMPSRPGMPNRPNRPNRPGLPGKPGMPSRPKFGVPKMTHHNKGEEPTQQADTTPPPAPAKKDHGATWIPIQRSVGPIHFERIGVSFKDGELSFLLDASMALGGLQVDLAGLTFGSPIDHFAPYFDLHGLLIDYKRLPSLEIGGGLLKVTPPPKGTVLEYDGAIVVKTKALSIIALGSYAKLESGAPSFFMYAAIDGLKIGPPWFMVTGLSVGFGINRKLVVPDIGAMDQFPLVSEVLHANNQPKTGGAAGAARNTLMLELQKLQTYISPEEGEYFIAVGLKFTSFKIIDAFALAVVQFGHRFRVDLFGRMFLRHPPLQGGGMKYLVNVAVDLHAYLYPDEGVLGFEIDIKEGSYVYSPLCHISGRIAMKAWFSGEHDGDFVFVLGGYHNLFKVPDNYPSRAWLRPLSLYWRLSDQLYIKGSAYFALTPNAIMAGGNLDAHFEVSHFKAQFHIGADFLIFFKPFWYDARIGVGLDIWVTIPLVFVDLHLHLGMHADLHLWGPDFSGRVHVEIHGIGFSVDFGAGSSQLPPIGWSEFETSFLPKPEKIFSLICEDGLISKIKDPVDDTEWWLVNRKSFAVTVNSNIPFTDAHFYPDGNADEVINLMTGNGYGISPMHLTPGQAQANLDVAIIGDGDIDADDFAFQPIYKNMPGGLWGDYRGNAMARKQVVPNLLSGMRIVPGKPPKPGETLPIPVDNLKYDSFNIRNSFHWEGTYPFKTMTKVNGGVEIKSDDLKNYATIFTGLMDSEEMDFDVGDLGYNAGRYVKDMKVGGI